MLSGVMTPYVTREHSRKVTCLLKIQKEKELDKMKKGGCFFFKKSAWVMGWFVVCLVLHSLERIWS